MNTNKILAYTLFLAGEVLLVVCFLYFGKDLAINILTLNIIVTSLVYCLLFADLLVPGINLKDQSQKTIGSVGLRWIFSLAYATLAIAAIICAQTIWVLPFSSQLAIHGILLFLLLSGLFFAYTSANKVKEVYVEEKKHREGIDTMKKLTRELQLKLDANENIPDKYIADINTFLENLRYLSPCNQEEARLLEDNYAVEIRMLSNCFSSTPLPIEQIDRHIKQCEQIYQERKRLFSN